VSDKQSCPACGRDAISRKEDNDMQTVGIVVLIGLGLLIAPLMLPAYIPSNAGYVMMVLGVITLAAQEPAYESTRRW